MYICEMCGECQPPRVPRVLIVIATAEIEFFPEKRGKFFDRGGKGTTIVEELPVCPPCSSLFQARLSGEYDDY